MPEESRKISCSAGGFCCADMVSVSGSRKREDRAVEQRSHGEARVARWRPSMDGGAAELARRRPTRAYKEIFHGLAVCRQGGSEKEIHRGRQRCAVFFWRGGGTLTGG